MVNPCEWRNVSCEWLQQGPSGRNQSLLLKNSKPLSVSEELSEVRLRGIQTENCNNLYYRRWSSVDFWHAYHNDKSRQKQCDPVALVKTFYVLCVHMAVCAY